MQTALSKLVMKITAYDPDRNRANHLLKVWSYASIIGEEEGLEPDALNTLQIAALLHDIGIKAALEKYGSASGEYQQIEGPPIARDILESMGCPQEMVERICYLIAHHHQYNDIDGLDYQILVESDFLVNCDEGGYTTDQVASIGKRIFQTRTGTHMINLLFDLELKSIMSE